MDNRALKDVLMSVIRSAGLDWLSVWQASASFTRDEAKKSYDWQVFQH